MIEKGQKYALKMLENARKVLENTRKALKMCYKIIEINENFGFDYD